MLEYEDLNPNFLTALKRNKEVPFWKLIGMELADAKKGWSRMRMPFADKLRQPYGIAHGGAIMSLADSAVAMALIGMVDRDEVFTTVELKINYLKPFESGEINAEARIISKGKTIALGDVDVWDSDGKLIAKCLATYSITKKK